MSGLPPGPLRNITALLLGLLLCAAVVTLLALGINRFDWGVGLLLLAPLVVWLLLRIARTLEHWAKGAASTEAQDPDFPDDSD